MAEVKLVRAADKAGIRPGGRHHRIDDTGITTITSLAEALAADRPGQKVRVTYPRDGKKRTAEVTLGEIQALPGGSGSARRGAAGVTEAPRARPERPDRIRECRPGVPGTYPGTPDSGLCQASSAWRLIGP
ncbi:hypothetical protein GCM10020367_17600 [Streptomyces sannanensis]|uniref:PDZ domain-containing protein n=1 Tax=Streptomyces sannanensis TaxID=285536 RepID=A0ABP6S840_9ACTN